MAITQMYGRTKGGMWLRTARLKAGLSLKDAARARGCSLGTVKRWEHRGLPRQTGARMIEACARAYKVTIDDLVTGASDYEK